MNQKLVSALTKGFWAINEEFALNQGPILAAIFNPEGSIEAQEEDKSSKPSVVSVVQDSMKWPEGYDEAEQGSVAIIPVQGTLMRYNQFCGPAGMETLSERVREADNHPNISAILLKIDSPGGTVDGTEEFGQIINATQKPVVAFVAGMMCSGAMWLGANANEIISSSGMNEIGSIGVMLSFIDMQPYYEAQGVKFHYINSDLSEDKNRDFLEARRGEYKRIKENIMNPMAEQFHSVIKANRPNVTDEQLKGGVFLAKDLVGTLIDSIGTFDYAVERAIQLSKPSKIKVYV